MFYILSSLRPLAVLKVRQFRNTKPFKVIQNITFVFINHRNMFRVFPLSLDNSFEPFVFVLEIPSPIIPPDAIKYPLKTENFWIFSVVIEMEHLE